MAGKLSPCENCAYTACPSTDGLPGCRTWRAWWIENWEQTRSAVAARARLEWDESGPGWICPVCGHACDDLYYLDKFCPGCGNRVYFSDDP